MAFHPLDITGILKSKGGEVPAEKPKPSHRGPFHAKKKSESPPEQLPRLEKPVPSAPPAQTSNTPEIEPVKIRPEFWNVLNEESRRMLTSRIWRGVDFNPMLGELDDLSKLTEKWLKWAVPTYVNGINEGPIKSWIEGEKTGKDFHYILVGEHLKHLKEVRQKKKDEPETIEVTQEPSTPEVLVTAEEPSTPEASVSAEEPSTPEASVSAEEPISPESPTPSEEPSAPEASVTSTEPTPVDTETLKRFSQSLDELDENIAWFQSYLDNNKKSND